MAYEQKIFSGDRLYDKCTYSTADPLFALPGSNISTGEGEIIPISEKLLSSHILLLGGIGSGKTNVFNLLLRNILTSMTQDDVVIIFDSKGDFYRNFYKKGDIVISNDENATNGQTADYWNIFREISVDDRLEENVLEISKTLFHEKINSSSQPFFPNAARDIFSAMLLELIRNPNSVQMRNNASLRKLFNGFSVDAMKALLARHPDLKAMESYIQDPNSGQTMGVVSELQQLVREIFVGNFAKNGSLSIREIVKNKGKKVVFVECDLSIGSMLTPIYRLIIDLAIKQALCRKQSEGNVYFIMDEFRLLPELNHMDNGVNFGRSLGAKFIVGVQNVDQVIAAYGRETASSLMSGFATNISFRVNDKNSREYIRGLYGNNIKLFTFMSAVQSRGVNEQLRDAFVVEDSDITSLSPGQAIVGILNSPPFRFQFREYK